MGSLNSPLPKQKIFTHGGTPAVRVSNEMMLRRSVLSCFLWEKEFYEDGKDIATRIMDLANNCSRKIVADLAVEARHVHGLRHVPLLLLMNLISRVRDEKDKDDPKTKDVINQVIRRPDEMTELLNMYWLMTRKQSPDGSMTGSTKIDNQLKKGLALAFERFNEYSLAKYNRDGKVTLRDVMFMSHPKPKNGEQVQLFKRVKDNALKTPLTWETRLSAGENPNKVFTEMLINTLNPDYKDRDNTLGYLALLRNLRNMEQANVDRKLMRDAILLRKGAELVFPFRFVAAARACPSMEGPLDASLLETIDKQKKLPGTTIVMVDCSGSMRGTRVSAKSDIDRITAAATLASMINGEDVRIYSFADRLMELPTRRGMAGVDSIVKSQSGGTRLYACINEIQAKVKHDRLIVITDEQDTSYGRDKKPVPVCPFPYMINVASYRNGVGYGDWCHLDGFSEGVLRFIYEYEKILGEMNVVGK